DEERNFYALDRLWKDCPTVEVEGLGENRPGPADAHTVFDTDTVSEPDASDLSL
ncbi:ribosome silencing factor, partial [Rhodococcus sp. IEGM 1379]|nr:ribosome silencing factor [Rhodococcus sp. IEGM 1379]